MTLAQTLMQRLNTIELKIDAISAHVQHLNSSIEPIKELQSLVMDIYEHITFDAQLEMEVPSSVESEVVESELVKTKSDKEKAKDIERQLESFEAQIIENPELLRLCVKYKNDKKETSEIYTHVHHLLGKYKNVSRVKNLLWAARRLNYIDRSSFGLMFTPKFFELEERKLKKVSNKVSFL